MGSVVQARRLSHGVLRIVDTQFREAAHERRLFLLPAQVPCTPKCLRDNNFGSDWYLSLPPT